MSRKNEFSRRNKRRSTPAVSTYASLESRKMLASISFDSGTLTLDGSGGDDVFRVNRIGATTLVARIDTPFETIIESFSLRSVNNVEIIGRNGDDLFNNGSDVQSTFFGQNGNDRAFGGRAADTFFGGDGDDLFFGRQGFDTAFATTYWKGRAAMISFTVGPETIKS